MPAELTPQGAKQLPAVPMAMQQVEERLPRDLGPEERARLRQLQERCLASFRVPQSDP